MLDTAYLRSNAADCVRMADRTENSRERVLLLDMAKAWVALSQQASKIAPDEARGEPH